MVRAAPFADSLIMTTQATAPIPEPPVSKRLTRSTEGRVIAGVAGGFGRYFAVDPVVVRLALIVLAFLGGSGLVLYAAAWLLVPSDDDPDAGLGIAGVGRRFGLMLGLLALTVVAGLAGFWGTAAGGATATGLVVIAVGALLAVGAFTGVLRWLIVPAIALALGAGAVAASDLDIRGGMGERIY